MGYNTKFSGVFMMGQKGQTLPYMINCISIMLNGRNHRGSFRGRFGRTPTAAFI